MASLLAGSYQPELVRGVEIPKPGGGVRQLGIPTVVDRLVQQAILSFPGRTGAAAGPNLFGTELRVPARAQRPPSATPGRGVRSWGAGNRCEPGPGEILRPSKPRHPDVPPGPENRRQTPATDCPSLPGSGDDAERSVHRATRRDTTGGVRYRRSCPICYWMIWTRSWSAGGTASVAMPTTVCQEGIERR